MFFNERTPEKLVGSDVETKVSYSRTFQIDFSRKSRGKNGTYSAQYVVKSYIYSVVFLKCRYKNLKMV